MILLLPDGGQRRKEEITVDCSFNKRPRGETEKLMEEERRGERYWCFPAGGDGERSGGGRGRLVLWRVSIGMEEMPIAGTKAGQHISE